MKYNVGDRVRIKSIDWYNENKDNRNEITFEHNPHWRFVANQSDYCGQIATITAVSKTAYRLEHIPWNWTDEMIEGLAEEEEIEFTEEDKYWCDIMSESDPTTYVLPEGYIFKDEHGNVINAQRIVLEKKKKEYPKFKVGDRIKRKGDIRLTTIKDIKDNYYIITIPDFFGNAYITDKLLFSNQNEYELFPNKFDITNLRPFDKVLVRGDVGQKWTHDFFGFMDKDKGYPFVCVGHYVIQCIPYEGNECLLGTTNDCDDFYKTW